MDDLAFNQTMYETFFNTISILIGFLQAAIFQFILDAKWKNKEEHKHTFRILFLVQEVLLLSFFYSLIYVYYFGTYVTRYPRSTDSTNWFINTIGSLNGFINTLILACIFAIFLLNLCLLLKELKTRKWFRIIVIIVFIGIFAYVIYLMWTIKPLIYIEKSAIIEILRAGTPCNHLFVEV